MKQHKLFQLNSVTINHLILDENGEDEEDEEKSFLDHVNPNSLEILQGFVEPNMKDVQPQDKFQFFRHGYFNVDPKLIKQPSNSSSTKSLN